MTEFCKEQWEEPGTIDLTDRDIETALINYPGDSTVPGFTSVDAFLSLINPLLKKLQQPTFAVNNKVHEIMEEEAVRIIDEVMTKKFPDFNYRFTDLVKRVLDKHRKEL